MSIKKMSKEELETLSYNDIANFILQEEEAQSTLSLFEKIVETLELPKQTIENKIGDFYTSLTTDKRFILLEDGNWDLSKNHKTSAIIIEEEDLDEIEAEDSYDDEQDDDEELDEIYNNDLDDDIDSSVEEYKNLVIVDEEDLGLEQ